MDFGALLATLGMNPGFAATLDQAGIPAPDLSMLGGPDADAPGLLGSVMGGAAGGGAAATAEPPAVPGAPNPMAKALAAAGAQGIVGAKPPAPIMSGGVTGGVRAPEPVPVKTGAPAIQALIGALMGGGGRDATRVPDLGSYIRGGRY